jgi:hypothetical protein
MISGSIFAGMHVQRVTIAKDNTEFSSFGPFLLDSAGNSIVRCFDPGAEVRIPAFVQALKACSFADLQSLGGVVFDEGSAARMIREEAFRNCGGLRSIFIPKPVLVLEAGCFESCTFLSVVIFEADSNLATIGRRAFSHCSTLPVICISSSCDSFGRSLFLRV